MTFEISAANHRRFVARLTALLFVIPILGLLVSMLSR
jgi:hypothetical protein